MNFLKICATFIALLSQSLAVTIVTFKQLNDTNKDKNKKLLVMLIIFIYCTISCFVISNEYRFIFFISTLAITIFFVLKINLKLSIVYAFNTEVIFIIAEIFASILLVIFGLDTKQIATNTIYNLVANVVIALFAVLIINIKPIKILLQKVVKIFTQNKNYNYYFYIFVIAMYLVLAKNGLEFVLKSNYYLNILLIVVIMIILAIIIRSENKNEKLNYANKQMLNYVTKYEKIITEQGKANHEFKNQLMVIRGYAQMGDTKKLNEYIETIINDTKRIRSSYLISQLNKFPDGGIKGLLYYKLSIIEENKIDYQISVSPGVKSKLKNLNSNMYNNVTKVLGVLLDNAIDSSIKSRSKKIIISVTKDKSNVVFTISNTYKGKINLSKIGTGYTTKGKGHGYGLKLVQDIMKENKIIYVCNALTKDFYTVNLTLKIKK